MGGVLSLFCARTHTYVHTCVFCLHAQAYREFCLMYDAFSVAEAVLPSRPGDQAAEVRIFHPPADDTKINRALLADKYVDQSMV